METTVRGIQPELLTDDELVKYAWLRDKQHMNQEDRVWFEELRKRLEKRIDEDTQPKASYV